MDSWRRRTAALGMICLLAAARPPSAAAQREKRTLLTDYQRAAAVAVVHYDGNLVAGCSEVLKVDDSLRDRIKVDLKSDAGASDPFLLFWENLPGDLRVFRSIKLPAGSGLKEYVGGAARLKDKKPELMRYFLDHFDAKEQAIADDARQEFLLPTKELMALGKTMSAERLAAQLREPKTDPEHCRLCGIFLGGCGTWEHADLLRRRIGELARTRDCDVSGLLIGYVMLRPKEAWGYAYSLLADSTQPEMLRTSALRTAAFIHLHRSDLVSAKELLNGVALLLDGPEPWFACISVEFLREAKAWERTDQVLDLYNKFKVEGFSSFSTNDSIVRFALQSPQPRAVAFIKELRDSGCDRLPIAEETLKSSASSLENLVE